MVALTVQNSGETTSIACVQNLSPWVKEGCIELWYQYFLKENDFTLLPVLSLQTIQPKPKSSGIVFNVGTPDSDGSGDDTYVMDVFYGVL